MGQVQIIPSDVCTDCGGNFKVLGADVMEELEYGETGQKMIQ